MAVAGNGSIVLGGQIGCGRMQRNNDKSGMCIVGRGLTRLHPSGEIDQTFNQNFGSGIAGNIYDFTLLDDDSIAAVGSATPLVIVDPKGNIVLGAEYERKGLTWYDKVIAIFRVLNGDFSTVLPKFLGKGSEGSSK
jgi:hypothetical protein